MGNLIGFIMMDVHYLNTPVYGKSYPVQLYSYFERIYSDLLAFSSGYYGPINYVILSFYFKPSRELFYSNLVTLGISDNILGIVLTESTCHDDHSSIVIF